MEQAVASSGLKFARAEFLLVDSGLAVGRDSDKVWAIGSGNKLGKLEGGVGASGDVRVPLMRLHLPLYIDQLQIPCVFGISIYVSLFFMCSFQ